MTHKEEIENSRVGGFGGSDAKLFYKIGLKGLESLSNTDIKRIRVAKGIDKYKPITQNDAMKKGHDFEDWYEKYLNSVSYIREPKISKKIAKNFDTFFHADFYNSTDSTILELKCVEDTENCEKHYHEQLQWQVFFSDLCTVCLVIHNSDSQEFNAESIISEVIEHDHQTIALICEGIKLLDENWNTLNLTLGDTLSDDDLMPYERAEIVKLSKYLSEIRELEERAETQRKMILDLMLNNDIQSIKSDLYSISLVKGSITKSFDKKKLFKEHPAIKESDYTKTSEKKPYIILKLKSDES